MTTLAEVLEQVKAMTLEQKVAMDVALLAGNAPKWEPQPGPQTAAYESLADILFYGGAAGGGKTDLLMGLALTTQQHSILFRWSPQGLQQSERSLALAWRSPA